MYFYDVSAIPDLAEQGFIWISYLKLMLYVLALIEFFFLYFVWFLVKHKYLLVYWI